MALDIVTAYQGTNHVTAAQMADFQRGLLGGDCILPVGNKMETEIQTANQITVADGVVVFDGIEFHIGYGQSENVAITSGTQGMMRNDIVCIQYSKDESSGIESAEFVTIAGTPVASDPQDPAYSNLDIRTGVFMSQKPFCRVRLNGTAIEAIDMLVEVYDKGIYQLNRDLADTEWQNLSMTSNFQNDLRYRKKGGKIYISGAIQPVNQISANQQTTVAVLPEEYRPIRTAYNVCQGGGMNRFYLTANVDGSLVVQKYGTTQDIPIPAGAWLSISIDFPAD